MFTSYSHFPQTQFDHANLSAQKKLTAIVQKREHEKFFTPFVDDRSSDTSSDTSPGISPGISPNLAPHTSNPLDDSYNLDTGNGQLRCRKPRANSTSSDSSESTY